VRQSIQTVITPFQRGKKAIVVLQAAYLDRTRADADAERKELEAKLAEVISTIATTPKSAFQMLAQERIDKMASEGPLPEKLDKEIMQQHLLLEFNSLSTDQQLAYATRGREAFQQVMQSAYECIREVWLVSFSVHMHQSLW
jgi:Skp family chaperone for outer membrane proteins